MNGQNLVSETLAGMSSGFFALVAGLVMVIGFLYLGKAIWIIVRRRK